MPERDQSPWWNADDDNFAGATPLFDGDRRPHPEGERVIPPPPPPPPPAGEPAGSAIGEALRLAVAVAEWSNQTGLTDTLRQLAAEAAEALTEPAADADAASDDATAAAGATPRREPLSLAAEPQMVCDYCPLCRGVEVMRHVQPQVSQGLAEAMASLTEALNVAVEGFAARNKPH